MVKVLYFARLKDALGLGYESLALDKTVDTVATLVDLLCSRGSSWQAALTGARILVAVNQEVTNFDAAIKEGDEIAFFPPVTGG